MPELLELQGHGDPLASVAWKEGTNRLAVTNTTISNNPHESYDAPGHGDPLLQEVKHHAVPTPLHAEHQGHGDPIMDTVMETWDDKIKESILKDHAPNVHPVLHKETKKAGDPLLMDTLKILREESGDTDK